MENCFEYSIYYSAHLVIFSRKVRQDYIRCRNSYTIALASTLMFLASGAAWWSVFRRPQLQPVVGRVEQDDRENMAAIALLAAFGLSLMQRSWLYSPGRFRRASSENAVFLMAAIHPLRSQTTR
jgi:hypothetical protein